MNQAMRSFLSFARATILGGVIFLLPLGIILVALDKIFILARPVGDAIHKTLFPGARTDLGPVLFAVLIVVVIAFGAGVFARSRAGRRSFAWLEATILERLPFYSILRQIIADLAGDADFLPGTANAGVVLVRDGDLTSIGFLVERTHSGDVVVFLPDAPSSRSGPVVLVKAEQVIETSLAPRDVLVGMRKLGAGLFDARRK